MANALIGHTGFVGGNLAGQTPFDDLYNSSNVEEIEGKHYELIVCAATPAEKWIANREPKRDLENISRLMGCLGSARADRVVLISTVDVYPDPVGVDEDTPIDAALGREGQAYGPHRLMLEKFVRDHFNATVVRLPGLFGRGLKKNVIYDFLHDNRMDLISADSVFQFYYLENLWPDIEHTLSHRIPLINFATEPMSVRELAHDAFGFDFDNPAQTRTARYDFRTKHAELFGGSNGYIYTKAHVMAELTDYVTAMGWVRAS